MIGVEDRPRRLAVRRNRDGFLLGASWAHHLSWERRLTHVYLGWWVLTITSHPSVRRSG